MIQKFLFNVFLFLFIFCFLHFCIQNPKRNAYELEYRILVFRPEYPGDWYQNLLFSPLSDSREIIPAPFITRLTSFKWSFSLINSLSLRRWLGTSYNHVVFVFDINVCNFRFDTQICSRRWGSGNDCMKNLVSSLFSNSSPRFQNGGTRSNRSNGLLFGPASSVSLVGISLCQGGKYLL